MKFLFCKTHIVFSISLGSIHGSLFRLTKIAGRAVDEIFMFIQESTITISSMLMKNGIDSSMACRQSIITRPSCLSFIDALESRRNEFHIS